MKAPPPSITSPSLRPRTLMSVGKKQTIVTGGAGFIGRNLIAALNARDEDNILVVDCLGSGERWKNLQGLNFDDFVDAADFRARVREHGLPQTVTVFHFGVSPAADKPDADRLIDENYRYSRELAEACLKSGARFIFASSAETYGSGEFGFFDSDEMLPSLLPLGIRGFSRHLFDRWALRSSALTRIAGLKFFDVYGPGDEHEGDRQSLVSRACADARARGAVTLFKSHRDDCPDGEQQHDYLHVRDGVAAAMFLYERADVNGLFNCGTGRARTALEVAQAVFAALGEEPKIDYVDLPEDQRATCQYFTQADITKLRAAGFDHEFLSLEDGVKTCLQDTLVPQA